MKNIKRNQAPYIPITKARGFTAPSLVTKRNRAWLLPLVCLAGYLFAWGTILVDRQMIIAEQAELRRELKQTKKQLKPREMMLDFGTDWEQMVIWNEEHKVEPPEEEGK